MPAKPTPKIVHLQEKYQLERERAGLKFLAHGASADMTDPAEQAFAQTWKGMKVAYTEAYRKKCAEEEEKQKAADAGKAAAPRAGPKAAAPAVPKTARAGAKAHAIAPAAKATAAPEGHPATAATTTTLAPGTAIPTSAQAPPPRAGASAPDATPATPEIPILSPRVMNYMQAVMRMGNADQKAQAKRKWNEVTNIATSMGNMTTRLAQTTKEMVNKDLAEKEQMVKMQMAMNQAREKRWR